ncbi:hypothetical protein AVEN_67564-1 [Araneus ventricosus]|uniref:Uncharacterized protein n=1 Tax=Araneus ventricosus TaxID=182803 RepID=A0A4Y2MK17_ARAVE|nr:hypothetical protein AVEN_67564-1 [Araneus ventricosus]
MENVCQKNKDVKFQMLELSRNAERDAHIRENSNLPKSAVLDIRVSYDGTWQKRGKAVKDNTPDVSKMKTSIFASLYHCMSTNSKPQHSKCPAGAESWCFLQRVVARGRHTNLTKKMKTRLSFDMTTLSFDMTTLSFDMTNDTTLKITLSELVVEGLVLWGFNSARAIPG